jgi:uncharacterized membrane protein
MSITIINLILLGISVFALKLVIAFKLIDFAYHRWINPNAGVAGRPRGRSSAEMILRERFASGEIDEAEMNRRLAVITNGVRA